MAKPELPCTHVWSTDTIINSPEFDEEVFRFSQVPLTLRRFRPIPQMTKTVQSTPPSPQRVYVPKAQKATTQDIYTDPALFMQFVEAEYPIGETTETKVHLSPTVDMAEAPAEVENKIVAILPPTVDTKEALAEVEKRIVAILRMRRDKRGFRLTSRKAENEMRILMQHLNPYGKEMVTNMLTVVEKWRTTQHLRALIKK